MINLNSERESKWKEENLTEVFPEGIPLEKSKVAIEAIKGIRTINEIAADSQVHPNQISQWKRQLLEGAAQIFSNNKLFSTDEKDRKIQQLYQDLGELQFELNWLKKKYGFDH